MHDKECIIPFTIYIMHEKSFDFQKLQERNRVFMKEIRKTKLSAHLDHLQIKVMYFAN